MSKVRSRPKITPTKELHANTPPAYRLVVESFVDEMTLLGASGWAWVPNSPGMSLEIKEVFKGRKLGRATANILRHDLKAAGKGTGLYGFRLAFDRPFTGHGRPTLRAYGGDKFANLVETALEVDGASTTRIGAVEGLLEQLSSHEATGWAWLPDQPTVSVTVVAVIDSRIIGRGMANIMRSDLFTSRRGTGRYGFTLTFEKPVADIKRLTIKVPYKNQSVSLPVLPFML